MDRKDFCWFTLLAFISLATGCSLLAEEYAVENDKPAAAEDRKREPGVKTLPDIDPKFVKETMFYDKLENNQVRCKICFKNCLVAEGKRGFCHNRENYNGVLYNVVYGRPSAVQLDPVEKEPLHHYLPGTDILCLGTAGCNFRCKFCHNWQLSQQSIEEVGSFRELSPEEAVDLAQHRGAPSISFTYNEPTVFFEYMYDVSREAKSRGLGVVFHSNGSMSKEPLRALLKYVDAVTIDLKGFTEEFYTEISQGSLQPVLETLKVIREEGVWLEVVNLVVPTLNDDPETIREMCRWIEENLGPETPVHFSRFFSSYKLMELLPTPVETVEEAHGIALEEGLQFVSIGNAPGHTFNSTFCPSCEEVLIQRDHFIVHEINIKEGKCRFCNAPIPGRWEQ